VKHSIDVLLLDGCLRVSHSFGDVLFNANPMLTEKPKGNMRGSMALTS
jgi:hypothetical protein